MLFTKGGDNMGDHPSKTRWESENVVRVLIKINRNQDPELFELLKKATSKSGLARELMNKGIKK